MDIHKQLGIKETDFRLVIGGSRIDYDATKEDVNLRKHGRSLKEALPILKNVILPVPNSRPFITHSPTQSGGEIRHQHMGLDKEGKIVFFVTTMRSDETVRIISLRRAHKREREVFSKVTGYKEL